MLPPHEIEKKQFTKSAFGYKPEEVDEYFHFLVEQYTKLYKENADMAKKLGIVIEKLEEYREEEESLKNALLTAQKAGESIVRDSRARAEAVLSDAKSKSEKLIAAYQNEFEQQEKRLADMKAQVSDFKGTLLTLYKEHIDLISRLPGEEAPAEKAAEPAREPEPREFEPEEDASGNEEEAEIREPDEDDVRRYAVEYEAVEAEDEDEREDLLADESEAEDDDDFSTSEMPAPADGRDGRKDKAFRVNIDYDDEPEDDEEFTGLRFGREYDMRSESKGIKGLFRKNKSSD